MDKVIIKDLRSPYHINITNVFKRHKLDTKALQCVSKKTGRGYSYDLIFPESYKGALSQRFQKQVEPYKPGEDETNIQQR